MTSAGLFSAIGSHSTEGQQLLKHSWQHSWFGCIAMKSRDIKRKCMYVCVYFYIYGLVIQMFKSLIQFLDHSAFIRPASHPVHSTAKELQMTENCIRPHNFYFALLQAIFSVEVNRKAKVRNMQSLYIT